MFAIKLRDESIVENIDPTLGTIPDSRSIVRRVPVAGKLCNTRATGLAYPFVVPSMLSDLRELRFCRRCFSEALRCAALL